jgi:hypothetical protein
MYQCHECGQIFEQYLEFYNHYHVSHWEDKTPRKFFPCYGCKTIFLRRKLAHQHKCEPEQNVSTKKKKRKNSFIETSNESLPPPVNKNCECDKCGEKFTSVDEMVCHKHTWCTKAEE